MSAVSSSLWFVPSVMAVAAMGLALAMAELDARYAGQLGGSPLVFSGTADGAGATLATIAGSVIGVAGVVFSITIVALSLASSQLGPRLLRNFMRDRSNQVVLGTFLGTFVYALVGLQAVDREAGAAGVPSLTVTGAFVLALASLAVLIHFIHHISSSMQADTVIASVALQLSAALDRMYPKDIGEEAVEPHPRHEALARELGARPGRTVRAARDGYVQAIDEEEVMRVARARELVLRLDARPGSFTARGRPLVTAWPPERLDPSSEAALQEAVMLGPRRTDEQDVEFLIDQLVEPAVRALSPSINDPFTAIACLDRLGSALGELATRRLPQPYRHDAEGRLRVIAEPPSFARLLRAAFDPIRQHGAARPMIARAMLGTLASIAADLPQEDPKRRLLQAEAGKVLRTSLAARPDPDDAADIRAHYQAALGAIGGGAT